MKKIIFSALCLGMALTMGAAAPKTSAPASKKGFVTLYCSQAFQGPEEWDRYEFPVDSKGYITIFDGKAMKGWRGYGRSYMPGRWVVDDGAIHFMGNQTPEEQRKNKEGGDIIFAHKFKNFELSIDWKICKAGNSGVFYLAQELANSKGELESIVVSGLESQVLDNANHPDAKLGKDGDRQSSSLYDLIPAKPQNQKPYGQWNNTVIRVENGTVTHFQNGVKVLQYKLWTPEWTALLQTSKFSEKSWPAAFEAFNNAGGDNHEGFIGLQDHGDDVWFKNIKVKILK